MIISRLQISIVISIIVELFVKMSRNIDFYSCSTTLQSLPITMSLHLERISLGEGRRGWNILWLCRIMLQSYAFNICVNLHFFKECSDPFRNMTCCFDSLKLHSMKVTMIKKRAVNIGHKSSLYSALSLF